MVEKAWENSYKKNNIFLEFVNLVCFLVFIDIAVILLHVTLSGYCNYVT